MIRKTFLLASVAAAAACLVLPAQAQTGAWPTRPVKIVVPFPAGGATDVITRALGQKLSEELGQSFVIENKPGAASAIGAELVARSAPDGYTLLMATSSSLVNNRFLYKKLSYDPDGFELLSLVCVTPLIVVANTALPADNVAGLVQYVKANPGKVNYASYSPGTISHVIGLQLNKAASMDMTHVGYKGSTPVQIDVMGGHVPLGIDGVATSLPYIRSGKLKAFAVSSPKRSAMLPDVPTTAEAGLKGFELESWVAIFAPAGTPPEVVGKLTAGIRQALAIVSGLSFADAAGIEIRYEPPAQLDAMVRTETAFWAKTIREQHITAD